MSKRNTISFLRDEESYLTQICLSLEDYMIFGSWSQIRKVENDNSMALPLTQERSEWKQRCLTRTIGPRLFLALYKDQQFASGLKIPVTPLH